MPLIRSLSRCAAAAKGPVPPTLTSRAASTTATRSLYAEYSHGIQYAGVGDCRGLLQPGSPHDMAVPTKAMRETMEGRSHEHIYQVIKYSARASGSCMFTAQDPFESGSVKAGWSAFEAIWASYGRGVVGP